MQGNKVIEIKSPEFTKGSEVNRLLLATRYDFILAMGDDTTDDDMFKALPVTAVTVKIGTASECTLQSARTDRHLAVFTTADR